MMMLDEDEFLMLSGLQHWCFCKRQCGLIHLDQAWAENRLTLEGQALHETVVEGGKENRPGIRIERNLSLKSKQLGIIGKADVVEFHRQSEGAGLWQPFPVEYKRGKPKQGLEDQVQLCAQAICLEEMYDCIVPAGALFYGSQKRRLDVHFTPDLREETFSVAQGFHAMMDSGKLPPSEWGAKCQNCSLIEICMPETDDIQLDAYLGDDLR